MNAKIQVTSVTQTANEVLGTKERKLHFLVISTEKGNYKMNVGEKTIEEVSKLIDEPKNKTK